MKVLALFFSVLILGSAALIGQGSSGVKALGESGGTSGVAAGQKPFVHPLCLAAIFMEDYPAFPECDEELRQVPVERGERMARVPESLNPSDFFWVEHPFVEGRYAGYSGYREAVRWKDSGTGSEFAILETVFNGGGTGAFSSIVGLERREKGDYVLNWRINGGDRCNDGGLRVLRYSGTEMIYASRATPFRLLNPTDEEDWRFHVMMKSGGLGEMPASFSGWEPYGDLANSAVSCAGEIIRRVNLERDESEVIGVVINFESFLSERQGSKQACVNEWLRGKRDQLEAGAEGWIPLKEWQTVLETLPEACSEAVPDE